MKKTRVKELFLTGPGLPGHATAIQNEVSRLISDKNIRGKMEGKTGDEVQAYIEAVEDVRGALIKSARAADFDFEKFSIEFQPLTSDLWLGQKDGKLHVG